MKVDGPRWAISPTAWLPLAVDGTPVATVEAVQKIMERIAEKKPEVVVLKVRRGIGTLFVELQSTWTTEAVGR